MSENVINARGKSLERRRHPRRSVVEEQMVGVELGAGNVGLLLDLSESGAAVQPYDPVEAGATSLFRFDLPHGRVDAQSIVAWVGDGGRTGLRFVNVPDETRAILRRWLGTPGRLPRATTFARTARPETPDGLLDTARLWTGILQDKLTLPQALERVALVTRDLLGAGGIAIALSAETGIVCRASAGQAPPVGASINLEHGLSAECIRSAQVVECPDTESDLRVETAACRTLNLRSAVMVPVLSAQQVVGIVAAFSPKPNAFCPPDIADLKRIAALVLDLALSPVTCEGPAPEDDNILDIDINAIFRGAAAGSGTDKIREKSAAARFEIELIPDEHRLVAVPATTLFKR